MNNQPLVDICSQALVLGCTSSICALLCLDGMKLRRFWRSEFFFYGSLTALAYYSMKPSELPGAEDSFLFGLFGGCAVGVWWLRVGALYLDKWLHSLSTQSLVHANKHSDIRKVLSGDRLPDLFYDPWPLFKKGAHFMGVDESGAPFYLDQLSHGFYGGTTGSGKGNALQSHAAQSILNDEALLYLDPKDDKYAPHAVYAACQKFHRPYRYINVGSDQPAQINVLAGASLRELAQLLQAGFSLTDKSTDGDYHRGNDRKAARHLAALICQHNLTLAEAFDRVREDTFFQTKASGFLEKLESVATLPAINAKTDESALETLVKDGGGMYVQSGMDEEVEKIAQRLILIRVVQIASSRDRIHTVPRMVCVIADEVRFQISRPLLNILSAGRDKSLRALLAFQSMADLRAAECDIQPDVIEGIVLENTPVKHIYRIEDPRTAAWLAEKSGQVLVRVDSYETAKNLLLAERLTKSGVREERAFLLDPNITLTLPSGWGALLHRGQVVRLLIRSLPCTLCKAAITVTSDTSHFNVSPQTTSGSFFSMEDPT